MIPSPIRRRRRRTIGSGAGPPAPNEGACAAAVFSITSLSSSGAYGGAEDRTVRSVQTLSTGRVAPPYALGGVLVRMGRACVDRLLRPGRVAPGLERGVERVLRRREVTDLVDHFVDSSQVEVDEGGGLRVLLHGLGRGG